MRGAGVRVDLDLCSWGRMLERDGVEEGFLGFLKSLLLLLSPSENRRLLHHSGERQQNLCRRRQETAEEIEEAKKLAYVLLCPGLRIVSHRRCMFRRRPDSLAGDDMAQKLQLLAKEVGFGLVDGQPGLAESAEHLLEVSLVLCRGP